MKIDLPEAAGTIPSINLDPLDLQNARWDTLLRTPVMWERQPNGVLHCYPIPLGLLFAEAMRLNERVRVLEEELAELWEASSDVWKSKMEALGGGKESEG